MSCYLRHLSEVLAAAGIPDTRESRRRVHAMIQEITGEHDCPAACRLLRRRRYGGRDSNAG
jgi:hypothetical protein